MPVVSPEAVLLQAPHCLRRVGPVGERPDPEVIRRIDFKAARHAARASDDVAARR